MNNLFYFITTDRNYNRKKFLSYLLKNLEQGYSLIQLRAKNIDKMEYQKLLEQALKFAQLFQAKILVNQDIDLALKSGAHGVHFSASQLHQLPAKQHNLLFAASCHNVAELKLAEANSLNFVTLSPVKETPSHPGTPTLGWQTFSQWVREINIPVYALGGMTLEDITDARFYGAAGIAGISLFC